MMPGFRVTKYRPGPVGERVDDWTSISDIGKPRAVPLTLAHYLHVEDAYVESVRRFMSQAQVQSLVVHDLEPNGCELLPTELISEAAARLPAVAEGTELAGEELAWAVRLNLREVLWCRLQTTAGFHVHFGYDYYMYISVELPGFTPPLVPEGMYVETFRSPHFADA